MRWLALPLALFTAVALADTFERKVVGIADGDTGPGLRKAQGSHSHCRG